MTHVAKFLTLLIFVAFAFANSILFAQDESSGGDALKNAVKKTVNAKTVQAKTVDVKTVDAAKSVVAGQPTPTAYATGSMASNGEVIYDESMMVNGYHGGVVQGMTYQAAPHVTYGAGLGTPAFGQIESGVWYNGPTWGLFPKHHRANAPHKTKARKFRFLPASWRR